jgi:hypothetical protein
MGRAWHEHTNYYINFEKNVGILLNGSSCLAVRLLFLAPTMSCASAVQAVGYS